MLYLVLKDFSDAGWDWDDMVDVLKNRMRKREYIDTLLYEADRFYSRDRTDIPLTDDGQGLAPHPVIPLTDRITCITSVGELRKLANKLDLCAGNIDYLKAAIEGRGYYYHYRSPHKIDNEIAGSEEGLLELRGERLRKLLTEKPQITFRDLKEYHVIGQLRGKDNCNMSATAWSDVMTAFGDLDAANYPGAASSAPAWNFACLHDGNPTTSYNRGKSAYSDACPIVRAIPSLASHAS